MLLFEAVFTDLGGAGVRRPFPAIIDAVQDPP